MSSYFSLFSNVLPSTTNSWRNAFVTQKVLGEVLPLSTRRSSSDQWSNQHWWTKARLQYQRECHSHESPATVMPCASPECPSWAVAKTKRTVTIFAHQQWPPNTAFVYNRDEQIKRQKVLCPKEGHFRTAFLRDEAENYLQGCTFSAMCYGGGQIKTVFSKVVFS